ncbi:tyrosine-protein phosphatase [Saccharopolyspora phatthalungensis]|uniref:Tyrosine specific protein phosphatases domain-containing protein n=1 Tax=Saccharopolyspora phatthalungensis TaxID=664693 RepID=A0A840QCT8_9PSEU|nr:tyrosine-protein phosphatase [Saccharopolyspora phatthalungensis]MBB5156265.1 hypothetical protein [Saccharopolyspora phatthalungensis]
MSRDLLWDGGYNVRDLGELPAAAGRRIRRGAVVRSASPAFLTEAGWAQLWEHGVRTVIDLTHDDDRARPDEAMRPAALTTLRLPLDPIEDTEFWGCWGTRLNGTPLYYKPFLYRFPDRTAQVVTAIAHAEPGGVLVHCSAGRDRTGLIALVLLALAGVAADDIIADHELSHERLRPMFTRLGWPDQEPFINAALAEHGTTRRETLSAALDSFDAADHLRSGGCTDDDLAALRERLLVPAV